MIFFLMPKHVWKNKLALKIIIIFFLLVTVRLRQRRKVHPQDVALRLRQRLQRLERRGRLQPDDLQRKLLQVQQRPVHLEQVEMRPREGLPGDVVSMFLCLVRYHLRQLLQISC